MIKSVNLLFGEKEFMRFAAVFAIYGNSIGFASD
jgi:hypothetical protein